jgi:hypothetical protein
VLPVLISFPIGCALGAACQAVFGLMGLWMPAGLALLAFAIGCAVRADQEPRAAAENAIR